MDNNKVKIKIAGLPFTLSTDNEPEYVTELASEIDHKISEIIKGNGFISPTQAAILAAIEYCDTAKKAESDAETMRAQLKNYLEDAAQAKSERDMLKREVAKLKKGGSVN